MLCIAGHFTNSCIFITKMLIFFPVVNIVNAAESFPPVAEIEAAQSHKVTINPAYDSASVVRRDEHDL